MVNLTSVWAFVLVWEGTGWEKIMNYKLNEEEQAAA
jgi:hypothetical protein